MNNIVRAQNNAFDVVWSHVIKLHHWGGRHIIQFVTSAEIKLDMTQKCHSVKIIIKTIEKIVNVLLHVTNI